MSLLPKDAKQLDSYSDLVKQQQETIVYLTEKLVEK